MRRHRLAAGLLLLFAAGCGHDAAPPPTDGPIPAGREYLLIVPGKPDSPVPLTGIDGAFYALDPGVRCRVVGESGDAERRVTVSVLEGPNQGTAGKASRSHLQPIR